MSQPIMVDFWYILNEGEKLVFVFFCHFFYSKNVDLPMFVIPENVDPLKCLTQHIVDPPKNL